MRRLNDILDLIGRILISFLFLFEAYDSFLFYSVTRDKMVSYGLSWYPELWLNISLFFLCIGGLFLLIGYRARLAAFLLLLYWVPLTFIVYNFWAYPVDEQREISILFMKNIAISGALLLILVNGSGRFSMKRLLDRRRLDTRI